MLADRHEPRLSTWTKEGGLFDLIAISVALGVIAGGLFIFNSASKNYRMSGYEAPSSANSLPATPRQ